MTKEQLQDRCRGSLVGGAVGDALGYPVEFVYSFNEIRTRYGEGGITEYDTNYPWLEESLRHYQAQFSDDTQMTLYTAEGLLEAERNGKPIIPTICNSYLAWFGHQVDKKVVISYRSALSEIKELNQRRAPGNTCLTALFSIHDGKEPVNLSKGCGGVMRVAPIGIYGACHGWTLEKTARIAGEAAKLTHLHPLSTYSSAALAAIVQLCLASDNIDADGFRTIVRKSLEIVTDLYGESAPSIDELRKIISLAIRMENSPLPDWEIIENILGGGWVAEETLAIAVFSVLRHLNDFNGCMICSVNHGGDSDSTGAVAGNIIGAILGYEAIPEKFTATIQLHDLLISMSDDLSDNNDD